MDITNLRKSITELNREDALQLVSDLRARRRQRPNPTKKTRKGQKAALPSLHELANKLSGKERKELLRTLMGE